MPIQVQEEDQKQRRLDRMRRVATGLLLAAAAVFLVSGMLQAAYPWLRFVHATAEAAMVGAIADWFAVTALFRYPLGLRIPHTAIVVERKDQFGATLATFMRESFLTREVLVERVRAAGVVGRLGAWLAKEENAARVAAGSASRARGRGR